VAELHWFPFFAKDWLSSPARMAMTPEQRGAYIDLLAIAWGNGEEEPSLEDSEERLAGQSGLGKRWVKLGPLVRAQFEVGEGRLYNRKLSDVWHASQIKHDQAVERGKNGGRQKAVNAKSKSSPTRDSLETKSRPTVDSGVDSAYQSESQEELEPLQVLASSAPGGARSDETPRAPAPTDFRRIAMVVDTRRARTTDGDLWWARMQRESGLISGGGLYRYAAQHTDEPGTLKERAHA